VHKHRNDRHLYGHPKLLKFVHSNFDLVEFSGRELKKWVLMCRQLFIEANYGPNL
jgi:hypothetical protein